ncbi:hypothetical protein Bca52824_066586 [Brassica carinata]|uniref:SAC domain-containing protein n=1 Tax=Brassica carinata TaxID=52824 RepID=A0A8X7UDI6_BRACI|nr:hypothetical protein Bca52824_066586 [Brassica carinata]
MGINHHIEFDKGPRETILRAEFANAIKVINKGLSKEDRLRPLHWDLHKHSRKKGTNVLAILDRLATYALNLTGIFCQLTSDGFQNTMDKGETASDSAVENGNDSKDAREEATTMLQKGILRTNCIDCLDRTNVAQYAYALQYGGSAAHNKAWSVEARLSHRSCLELCSVTTVAAYMDAEKQDHAINLFLGYFQPQQDKPALWELGSDQHYLARFLASSVPENSSEEGKGLSDSAPEISTSETAMIAASLSAPPPTLEEIGLDEILENDCFCNGDQCTCAAFDMDWVSSSANSCEDESGRSTAVRSFETIPEKMRVNVEKKAVAGIPQGYVRWVMDEEGHFW